MSKILLVEDNPAQLDLMEVYLRDGGHLVIRLSDPKEALNKAIEQKPDVIVTDVVMPGMSGFELCRRLKQNPATAILIYILHHSH
jgi:chemotaxis family two-component system response regulator PixH